jgi:hypothetical protein
LQRRCRSLREIQGSGCGASLEAPWCWCHQGVGLGTQRYSVTLADAVASCAPKPPDGQPAGEGDLVVSTSLIFAPSRIEYRKTKRFTKLGTFRSELSRSSLHDAPNDTRPGKKNLRTLKLMDKKPRRARHCHRPTLKAQQVGACRGHAAAPCRDVGARAALPNAWD